MKDCKEGQVQVSFVGGHPDNKKDDYGWGPQESAFLELYVDGNHFRINLGNVISYNKDGESSTKRGLHIVTDKHMEMERTASNSCNIILP